MAIVTAAMYYSLMIGIGRIVIVFDDDMNVFLSIRDFVVRLRALTIG